MYHGVGCTDSSLDVKARVAWAWRAVRNSPEVKRGVILPLSLNVTECSVNGSKTSKMAKLLSHSAAAAGQVLPALAQSWNSDAPSTLRKNMSLKLGSFYKVKRKSMDSVIGTETIPDSDDEIPTVEECCALPMTSLDGAKRAAQAMLVASVFAAELSAKEHVPVLVLGRPPGHHATCAHTLDLDAPSVNSPGGALTGHNLGGGCFYPSCWLAAVHCLREGLSQRLAYIDVDAHKPDGVWKEVDHLCTLNNARRTAVLKGRPDSCEGVLFGSVHVDGYPKPHASWQSVSSAIPKSHRRAFEIRVHEELLPPGIATGCIKNDVVLDAYQHWRIDVTKDIRDFKPSGLFVGLGFDLHKLEKQIGDKEVGIGLEGKHYRKLIQDLPSSVLRGPVVLTLEGGYTKAGVVDGMLGVLSGLERLSIKASKRQDKKRKQLSTPRMHKIRLRMAEKLKSSPSKRKGITPKRTKKYHVSPRQSLLTKRLSH